MGAVPFAFRSRRSGDWTGTDRLGADMGNASRDWLQNAVWGDQPLKVVTGDPQPKMTRLPGREVFDPTLLEDETKSADNDDNSANGPD